jgi:hypothetical protein
VRIIQEKPYHSEDFANDPDAEVLTFNPKTNATETKKVSELDEKAKQRMKEIIEATLSINVSATKPRANMQVLLSGGKEGERSFKRALYAETCIRNE